MTGDLRSPPETTEAAEPWLTRAEASVWLATRGIRLKPASLARMFSTGADGPACRHVRGKPYYPRDVLRAWADRQISELRTTAPPKKARRHVR